jgi:uncharacterized damage-inducible protein DinB
MLSKDKIISIFCLTDDILQGIDHKDDIRRHILESEHLFHTIVNNRGNLGDYPSPWKDKPYSNIQDEIDFAKPYRVKFIETINSFSVEELENDEIIRSEVGQRRKLGDYLYRIAYHESIHSGQLLSYMRTFGIERPNIWD